MKKSPHFRGWSGRIEARGETSPLKNRGMILKTATKKRGAMLPHGNVGPRRTEKLVKQPIYYLLEDLQKAKAAEAWMLAFAGICVAIDFLAEEWVFNTEFLKKNPPDRSHPDWVKQSLEKWEKYKERKQGIHYEVFAEKVGKIKKEEAIKLWEFRCCLLHNFSLQKKDQKKEDKPKFSITHEKANDERELLFRKDKNGDISLHLPDLEAVLERMLNQYRKKPSYEIVNYQQIHDFIQVVHKPLTHNG